MSRWPQTERGECGRPGAPIEFGTPAAPYKRQRHKLWVLRETLWILGETREITRKDERSSQRSVRSRTETDSNPDTFPSDITLGALYVGSALTSTIVFKKQNNSPGIIHSTIIDDSNNLLRSSLFSGFQNRLPLSFKITTFS